MIKKINELDIALDFIVNVYNTTIYLEDSTNGQRNFINNYVYGDETINNFENGIEEYYGYYDEQLVGVVSLSNSGYIKFLFVDKCVQGIGIGKKLLLFIIELAKQRKIKTINLDSSLKNIDFYLKFGFRKTSLPICKDEIWFIPMEKDI